MAAAAGGAAFLASPLACAVLAAEPGSAWLGRWDLYFEREAGSITTVSVIERNAAGQVTAATIGPNPMGLSLSTLAFDGPQARMAGSTALGPVHIELSLQADTADSVAEGTWAVSGPGNASGRLRARRRSDARTQPLLALFDHAVATLEAEIFSPLRLPASWPASKQVARTAVQTASTERELVLALRTLLRASQLSHMGFYLVPTWPPEPERVVANVSQLRLLGPGLGLLRMVSFAEGPAYRAQLDAALAGAAGLQRLLIDLRGNTGGSLNLAVRLGDHLFDRQRAFGLFAARRGLARFSAADIEALDPAALPAFDGYEVAGFQAALQREGALRLLAGGRAPFFAGPVAVLQDEVCASTTEALLATLKETGRARLFGTKSAGAMLSSSELAVGDGYVLRLPYADFRTVQGRSLEGLGVVPDVELGKGLFGDRVQDAALAWLAQA
jgi:hypothetical protein